MPEMSCSWPKRIIIRFCRREKACYSDRLLAGFTTYLPYATATSTSCRSICLHAAPKSRMSQLPSLPRPRIGDGGLPRTIADAPGPPADSPRDRRNPTLGIAISSNPQCESRGAGSRHAEALEGCRGAASSDAAIASSIARPSLGAGAALQTSSARPAPPQSSFNCSRWS